MIDIIQLLTDADDTPIDIYVFDSIMFFCQEICASFNHYW